MGLKDRIKAKNASLVERETITLPKSGETVTVRGLMSGALLRINAATEAQRQLITVALCLEDPETPGALVYTPHSQEDLDAIGAFHQDDLVSIVQKTTKLSGVDETPAETLGKLARTENSSSSSPSVSVSSPTS